MSAYCIASEDERHEKNQNKTSIWAGVKELYDANHAENPGKLGNRNIAQIKGRYKRFNKSVGKWVGVYREAYRKIRSGMSMKDIENEAHKLYETSGSKFNETIVFNEVMCKHRKWGLQLDHDATRSRPKYKVGNEESGGSTKRSISTEKGSIVSNPTQKGQILLV
ncbi:unnamed protein product [Lactuca saligna]|uniref:Uncharacterized protein n=1 Tax=Lactuca saligna TaxID=75948 RepID=A0AA35URP7_LACSI|nr:unnamed protein product [Lactuca saligna]